MEPERMVMSTATESQERAAKLLPTVGSEDCRGLLVLPDFSKKCEEAASEESPENPLGWTLYLEVSQEGGVPAKRILELLNYDWRWDHDRPDIYGRTHASPWIHLAECAETDSFSELAVTWSLVPDREGWQIPTAASLDGFRQDLEDQVRAFGGKVVAQTTSSEVAAVEVPQKFEDSDRALMIVLNAPEGELFEGRDIWDVMLSLGLRWGDMDIFHWEDPELVGGDPIFSVWTTTQPNYFLPEEIAAGRLKTRDLVFQFSIPLCAVPEQVFDAMLKAATYAQRRLGGWLSDRKRRPFDEGAVQAELAEGIALLKSLGIEPGSERAFELY